MDTAGQILGLYTAAMCFEIYTAFEILWEKSHIERQRQQALLTQLNFFFFFHINFSLRRSFSGEATSLKQFQVEKHLLTRRVSAESCWLNGEGWDLKINPVEFIYLFFLQTRKLEMQDD